MLHQKIKNKNYQSGKIQRVLILGAGGRDFHNFNVLFRSNPNFRVAAFTAAQIPNIANRRYPAVLAGPFYPRGISILPEKNLAKLIKKYKINIVVFAYSDVSHENVMHKASEAIAAGADFMILGTRSTMIKARKPVISVCATRTGAGKSQTVRRIAEILKNKKIRYAVVRHPMPYGDLAKQTMQIFETLDDLDRHHCTIEEREDYEPHLEIGSVVLAGVDYEKIIKEAARRANIIIWDGGNNDFPFVKSDLHIVVADPFRTGHELKYHPGETNLRMADIIIINKVNTAPKQNIRHLLQNIQSVNPKAKIIKAASVISTNQPQLIRGKNVLVVEDGPTLTHGEMSFGAGYLAAKKFGAKRIINPKKYAVGSIAAAYKKYPHIGPVLPALGYGKKQIKELETTIRLVPSDSVVMGTPADLRRFLKLKKPAARVFYELKEQRTQPDLETRVLQQLKNSKIKIG